MVLIDAELLADIDPLNEALATHEKHDKDFQMKALASLLKMERISIANEGEILEDLIAEMRKIKEAKAVNIEHMKDLTMRLRAIAEKEASSSK